MIQRLPRLCLLALLCLSVPLAPVSAEAATHASILVDAETGQVLEATNADALTYPASLTKMMTLYLTFEALHSGRLSWDQRLVISKNANDKDLTSSPSAPATRSACGKP
jgi:D-alanyl-D-alanine carboxypeptidase (penicillin-binding protein 5/6)